jgi:hypothetical protein
MSNSRDLTRREFVTDAGKTTIGTVVAVLALRAGPGKKPLHDGERGPMTHVTDANRYLPWECRAGCAV